MIASGIVVGGIALEGAMPQKGQSSDCSCPDETLVQVQQQKAGWFWGKHCKNGVGKYRVFGITVRDNLGCCYD